MMEQKTMSNIENIILFQAGWLACVLGALYVSPVAGVIYAFCFIAYHLYLHKQPLNELVFILLITVVGYLIDSQLVRYGYFDYYDHQDWVMAPLWIAALWAMFSTTIGRSLSWLSNRLAIAVMLGAIFGPVAYYSAAEIGAVSVLKNNQGLYVQSLIWAVMMPVMFRLYEFTKNADLSLLKGKRNELG